MDKNIFRLDGKTVVISGAAGLLGRQHANAVAAFGGIPVLLDLNKAQVDHLSKNLRENYGVESAGYAVDITKEEAIKENAKVILYRFGKIDALVNNAANNPKIEKNSEINFSRLENFPLEIWDNDIAVGLTGAFICAKHYGSAIATNQKGGVIINISSDLGLIAPDQRLYHQRGLPKEKQPVKPVSYSVIKTGLIGLTRYLATYWPDHVRCNALCPGGVEAGQAEEFLCEVKSRIPMGRMAMPNEYQGALLFLLSDASKYMNGAVVPLDGGRTAW